MLLSDLPPKLIEQFTEHLSLEDKISCSLVCKSWKEVFQDSLRSELVVERQLLDKLVNKSQDYQPLYGKPRCLVQDLKIGSYTLATDEELHLLQKTFPNIKHLHFEPESILPDNFGVTADWNIWRSLTELRITFDQAPVPDIENSLVKTILCLPLLRRLAILNKHRDEIQVAFSLDDFETIHSHLKHLGYLELHSNLLTLSKIDTERMSKVLPATNMGNLDITSGNTDHRWLCYFARKYPNLHTLNVCTANILPERNKQRSDTTALFQQVPLPFQHLTKLNLEYRDFVTKSYLLFWDIMHFHNMPLKHVFVSIDVSNDTYYPDSICDILKHISEVCLPEFSKTIESFCLKCPYTHSTPIDLTGIKSIFYNLVDLNITAPTSVEMDTLLCAAPRLKSLTLNDSDIKFKGELYNSNRFGLQSFKVSQTKIPSDVLRFLSFHCRSLNELTLNRSTVYGNFTAPGCQFIDMTYTRLENMYLEMTDFIIQDNNEDRENINITLITRPVDDIHPKQDYDPNVLPVVIGGPPVKAHYNWFYRSDPNTMWKISTARGSRVQKFVLNYEENKRIISKRALDAKKRKPYESWNNNCFFGYTKIKLGYVRRFEIHYSVGYTPY